jgi:hypothetical protein
LQLCFAQNDAPVSHFTRPDSPSFFQEFARESADGFREVHGRRLLSLERKNSGNFRREGQKCQSLPPLFILKVLSMPNPMKSRDFADFAGKTPQSKKCDTLRGTSRGLYVRSSSSGARAAATAESQTLRTTTTPACNSRNFGVAQIASLLQKKKRCNCGN